MSTSTPNRTSAPWALVLLTLLLVVGLPPFIRMPVWCDVAHYDICARNVLDGGVHYRDVFDTNLPGMVWLHAAVRSAFGWSSEAIRVVDFLVFSGIVWLLVRWLRRGPAPRAAGAWMALVLFVFYFSTTEHCHVQRDVWMLLPALAAIHLRARRVEKLSQDRTPDRWTSSRAAAEGACWAAAFWIKPFVIVPALFCWIVSIVPMCRKRPAKIIAADGGGLLAGGVLVGAAGLAWLWWSGAWSSFWDVILSWNRDYSAWPSSLIVAMATLIVEFPPWIFVHLAAVPVAVASIGHALSRRPTLSTETEHFTPMEDALLGAFYLGWLFQAVLLQHGFVYQHVPPILLGIAVVSRWYGTRPRSRIAWVAVVFVGAAIGLHPLVRWERLQLWGRCLVERSSSELKDRLALTSATDWQGLEQVAQYLRSQNLRDGELTCFGAFTVPLYLELDLKPSTRFLQLSSLLSFFPNRKDHIRDALAASSQQFVVSDVQDLMLPHRLTPEEAIAERPGRPLTLPPAFPASQAGRYPWSEPVVFRAGRYFVHRVEGPIDDL